MKDEPKRVCGAKNRQGNPCQRAPLEGKARCRLHGGATPRGGPGNNLKHGLYSKSLTPEEHALWEDIPVGEVDTEIRMAKVMLNRCLALHAKIQEAPNDIDAMPGFELSEVKDSSTQGRSITSKRPDTLGLIDRYMQRVANLEKTRAELIAAAAEHVDNPADKASEIRAALQAMIEVETRQPAFDRDANGESV